MSKRRPRTQFAREIQDRAASLGYDVGWTETGHIRCVHRRSGAIVILPSKGGGRLERGAYRMMERMGDA